ncbi:hypothetical protein ABZ916_22200 [Streptomyces sp. NPDC046853]|uniref:hypothetical protein n=1 Tax=Streptomyces sp. NPDC046853 TaxID=3154920 RepID=UPI0033C2DADF
MSDTARSGQDETEPEPESESEPESEPEPEPEAEPEPEPESEPASPPERAPNRFSDGPPDPLASQLAKINRGERIPTPGDNPDGEDRDPEDEQHREHDSDGRFAQRRKRKN